MGDWAKISGRLGDLAKKMGDWEIDFFKMGAGSTIFSLENIFFKNIKFTCYIYYHLNDKSGPYPWSHLPPAPPGLYRPSGAHGGEGSGACGAAWARNVW